MGTQYAPLPPRDANGFVIGRYSADPREIEDVICALPDAAHRTAIWDEWKLLTRMVQEEVGPVAACWLAGSFFTDKAHPGDIDSLYVIHHEVLKAVLPGSDGGRLISAMKNYQIKSLLDLRVDAPILPWWPRPGTYRGSDDRVERYLGQRGYWDDLWSRERDNARPKESGLIRRGYLEVIVDGYQHP